MNVTTINRIGSEAIYANIPSANIIRSLATSGDCIDRFYLTGFEGLCLSMNHAQLTEAVISSVVPMGGELLVVGSEDCCSLWRNVCHSLNIRVSAVDTAKEDVVTAVATILSVNPRISHVMTSTHLDSNVLCQLGATIRSYHKQLVVDNSDDELTVEAITEAGIDFAIAASETEDNVSVIIARRSRLVMTEGNARRSSHDIYALWQSSLSSRNSTWLPMA
ncbi:MAG: hypothetical protein II951_07470 [Bacteroidales bacterium]|nr:hypothetical protein [Bacteroidales bacterium]